MSRRKGAGAGQGKAGDGGSSANLGFEAKLWLAADKLRNNMDAAEYKHVVLGLIFLKYISDSFEAHDAKLAADEGDYRGANPEAPHEYRAENMFWVPKEARWTHLQGKAKLPTIGKLVDDAMVAIELDNPRLKGALPKDYARPALDNHRLGELIDRVGTIGLRDKDNQAKDILRRVYEYFLTQFASAERKNGGPFYTPQCMVRIAAIHGALDDKIELIRQMNATLESMARALFQSWFVDADVSDSPPDVSTRFGSPSLHRKSPTASRPPQVARRFDELTIPLLANIRANSCESRTLANLRDTLPPKLLNGELRSPCHRSHMLASSHGTRP